MTSPRKPRILFLNRSYWPDMEATGQLLTALCEGLAQDFEVHVLAGLPNATSTDGSWEKSTERNGVHIHRVSHTTLSKSNMVLKGINFLSFIRGCRREIRHLPAPDIVVFETDPFLLPFVADACSRRTGCKMIGYLQDIYPDVAVALNKVSNNWAIRRLREKMFGIYRRCSQMVVLSTDMKQLLLDSGISEDAVSIVPNWADTDLVHPIESDNQFRKKFDLGDKFVCMYSGNLGLTQRLNDFIDAAKILEDDEDVQFVFVGRGAQKQKLEEQVASLGLTNTLFCDYQPLDQLSHSLSAADLHLIPLTAELSRCLMPSKLYGILASGRPYLTNAPEESELFRITTTEEVGFTTQAGSPQKIADAIRDAKSDSDRLHGMGQRARWLAEARYTSQHSTAAFAELLRSALGNKIHG